MGVFLQQPLHYVVGTSKSIDLFKTNKSKVLSCHSRHGNTVYFLKSQIQGTAKLSSLDTVYSVDYELMHKRFGHPSKQVLENAKEHTKNFPRNIQIPQKTPVAKIADKDLGNNNNNNNNNNLSFYQGSQIEGIATV